MEVSSSTIRSQPTKARAESQAGFVVLLHAINGTLMQVLYGLHLSVRCCIGLIIFVCPKKRRANVIRPHLDAVYVLSDADAAACSGRRNHSVEEYTAGTRHALYNHCTGVYRVITRENSQPPYTTALSLILARS